MRKFSLVARLVFAAVFALSTALCSAQDSIQYQLVIRNSAGQLITNKQVSMKFSLIGGEQTYYQETMPATTDKFGNISVMVGTGKALKGAMKDVPWSTMEISLKVEADTEGGEKYAELGTVPIAAAPYAMYAATAGGNASSGSPKGDEALFEVCDRDGQPVFAVYDDGIVVYVDQNSADKAKRSGLVVTGRKATKEGETADYFAVDAEGTHIYVDDADDNTKAKRSGFVVTGRKATKDGAADSKPYADDRSATKADGAEVFAINGGLTTIYVDDTDDNAKAKRSGFVVTGRKATKAGENIIDIDAYHANLATDELSISENTVEQSGEQPEPVQPKSVFTVTGGNVQMNTEVSMIGDMEKKVEADILEEAPMITVNDDLYVFNGLQYFAENEPRITDLALMAIYDDGAYVPKTDENFILFDESGFVTKQHSQAAVVLELNKKEPVVSIRPLKPMNKTIEFGLMDANNVTEPYQFVKLTAKIEAETGLPFVLGESENGKVIVVNGELFYGERVELTAVPDPGYVFKDWGINTLTNNPYSVEIPINYQSITAIFAEPKLYVKASSVDGQGGSDSNSGFSEDEPLASINGAINRIGTSNSKTNWTINVIGEITGEQTITDNEGTTPIPAETITITGQSNSKDGGQGVLKGEWDGVINTEQSTKASILSVKTSVPIIVENLTITRGYAVQGGAINIGKGGNVTLGNGAFVTENLGTLCAGIYIEGGGDGENTKSKLIIADGCQITKNTTNDCGGGVRTSGKVEIVMTGGEIKDNKVNMYHGGGLYLAEGTKLYMTNGFISGNNANSNGANGGGIWAANGTELYIMGGQIYDNNSANYGGGIYGDANSLIVVGGSAVIGNAEADATADDTNHSNYANYGGGIYSIGTAYIGYTKEDGKDPEPDANFTGGLFFNYALNYGGGLYCANANAYLNGNVNYNRAGLYGGGVCTTNGSTFEFIGGNISHNAVPSSLSGGGGVYVNCRSTFNMKGGTISENIIDIRSQGTGRGAGVYLDAGKETGDGAATFNMSGGTITGNKFNTENSNSFYGKGVYAGSNYNNQISFNICGSVKVDESNDIYLAYGLITVDGELADDAIANISLLATSYENDFQVLQTGGEVTNLIDAANHFIISQEGWGLIVKDDDQTNAVLQRYAPVYVGANDGTADGSQNRPYPTIAAAVTTFTNPRVSYTIKVLGELVGDQEVSGDIQARKIIISGDGNSIINGNNSVDAKGSVLTVKDTQTEVEVRDLKITGGYAPGESYYEFMGGGIFVSDNCKVTLGYGAVVTGNTAGFDYNDGHGGGVYVGKGATLIMNSNAQITGNQANRFGGGVYVDEGATFVMNDAAKITGNKLTSDSDNDSYGGFAVYVKCGTFTMNGGEISGHQHAQQHQNRYRGTVRLEGKCIFNMLGGQITNNKDQSRGANIYAYGEGLTINISGDAEISNGYIESSVYDLEGAGICLEGKGATLNMNGGAIKDNKIKCTSDFTGSLGAGIYIGRETKFVMTGGTITGNMVEGGKYNFGGAVCSAPKDARNSDDNSAPAIVEIGGDAYIPAGDDNLNDFYLCSDGVIDIVSNLTKENAITITPEVLTSDKQMLKGLVADNLDKINLPQSVSDCGIWSINNEGILIATMPETIDLGCAPDIINGATGEIKIVISEATVTKNDLNPLIDALKGSLDGDDIRVDLDLSKLTMTVPVDYGYSTADYYNYLFYYCFRLQKITLPEFKDKDGNNYPEIATQMFYSSLNLEEVIIPATITKINAEAFGYDERWYDGNAIKVIHYGGNKDDLEIVEDGNGSLQNVTWHYNSTGE